MRTRLPILFLVFGLALLPAWAATAAPPHQDSVPEQPFPAEGGVTPDPIAQSFPLSLRGGPEPPAADPQQFLHRPFFSDGETAEAAGASAVPLGQPGLSFRYVQTFGETERAYFDDTAHLNYPYGVTTDSNNVWIADSLGLRAVKYGGDGTFVTQIGKSGFRYGTGQSLEFVADVGVDSGGNVWRGQ